MKEIKFSFFHSEKGISNKHPQKEIDLNNLFRIFQSEKLVSYTNAIKNAENEDLQKELKLHLPFITPFGTFEKKENSLITHYNQNFIAFDFDYLEAHEIEEIKNKAKHSQNVIYCGISPRGKGVKMLMFYNHLFEPGNHSSNLKHYAKSILKTIGIEQEPDPLQFTLSQAMFLSHDPNAYYNLYACATNEPLQPFKPTTEKPAPKINIKSNSRIDKFLIGSLRKKIEFLINTKEGERHSALINCIQIVGLMKYYAPHLEDQFYNTLKQAIIIMYGNEQNAISSNGINSLNDIFMNAEFRTLDKIDEIILDIEKINKVFHCFENNVEIEAGTDVIKWNDAKNRLTWSLNGYRLIVKEYNNQNITFYYSIHGMVTQAKIDRLNLFDFIDIEILPINKMLVNGKIWSGCEKNYSLKNELA